jgi:hypothetical protein
MPDFRSLADIEKHFGSNKGKSELISQENIKSALISETERLQRYLIEEINNHLDNFTPTIYKRTGAWLESIRINPPVLIGDQYSMSITFDDNFAYHPSVVPNGEPGYIPWLMEDGWKDKSYIDPHFDGFSGTHYIKNAVERWNNDNKFGFKITVYHGDEIYI